MGEGQETEKGRETESQSCNVQRDLLKCACDALENMHKKTTPTDSGTVPHLAEVCDDVSC